MSSVLDQLRESEAANKAAASQAYKQLVVQLAIGEQDPELGEVQEVLAAAGKTAEQLSDAVGTAKHRNRLRDKLTARDKAAARREEITGLVTAADNVLKAAQAEHGRTVWPLQQESSDLVQVISEGQDAENQLFRNCSATLRGKVEANRREAFELDAKCNAVAAKLPEFETSLTSAVQSGDREADASLKGSIGRVNSQLADLQSQLNKVTAEGNELYSSILLS